MPRVSWVAPWVFWRRVIALVPTGRIVRLRGRGRPGIEAAAADTDVATAEAHAGAATTATAVRPLAPEAADAPRAPESDTRPVIVLGGGSDIGLAIAREFVARGSEAVVLAGRDQPQMRQQALEAGIGVRIETMDFDARRTDLHVLAIEEAFTLAGEVQAVVLAFGVLGDTRSYEANPALAGGAAATNFAGGVTASLAAVRALARQERRGTLVVLSSAAMLRPRPSNYIYGATKAGLDFFARGLADSARGRGVHVMIVRPGFVATKMTRGMRSRLLGTTPERVARDVVDDVADGREVCWSPRVLRWLSVLIRLAPGVIVRRV